ncbi:MAG TPA: PEP-CTERM sorting domain-containing protein [Verrucomicrobiae bacterium]|jgi:hypothetical protein|nr:PEP-CTERM sorting domain-containing protein [Verrucomicrobiae bacterium]
MTTSKLLKTAVCVAVASLGVTALQAQNLLTDPGFENQTPAANGGWNLFNGAAFSSAQAHTGTMSMLDTGAGGFSVPGSDEVLPTGPGVEYQLTGFGLISSAIPANGDTDNGILQITFWSGPNATGNNLGSIDISNGGIATGANNAQLSNPVNSSSPVGQWIPLDTGIAQAPVGAVSLEAFTLVLDQDPTAVYFDDLTLTLVQAPEPGTLTLLGLSLLGIPAFAWRRKK